MNENILAGKTALVVDDDEFMCELLCNAMGQLGIQDILSTDSGAKALEILTANPAIDFIFCDLQMPVMDGVEVIRYLADTGYSGGVILVSGEDQRILETAQNVAEVRGLNVIGSLTKPVAADTIYELLKQYHKAEHRSSSRPPLPEVTIDELRAAIDAGEITPYFQPQMNIETGVISSVETLARWLHPEKGMIPPIVFVALAEEGELIEDLTETIINQALRQGSIWKKQGHPLKISINLSMDNLQHLDIVDRLVAAVNASDVDVSDLMLEVTESRLVKDLSTCLDVLTRLRLKGFGLSIDDFGTGYASMEQLKMMPFVELKVDRSFVHKARNDRTRRAILESSISLGKQLGASIVAEGVENQDDWDLVAELGCDIAQGYYIARPMAAEDLDSWFGQHKQSCQK